MNTLVIGPYFSHIHAETAASGQVVPLGIQMEWATTDAAVTIPIFRARRNNGPDRLTLERIVVSSCQLPFYVECARYHVIETSAGLFLPLEALLAGLYEEHRACRSIFQVLTELGTLVPLGHPSRPLSASLELLNPEAERQGFVLSAVVADESGVYAEIGWRPPQQSYVFHTCICAFNRTLAGTPGQGRWQQAGTSGVGQVLSRELQRVFAVPSDLFTPFGLKRLQESLQAHSPDRFSR
jgi:hypothetical protein